MDRKNMVKAALIHEIEGLEKDLDVIERKYEASQKELKELKNAVDRECEFHDLESILDSVKKELKHERHALQMSEEKVQALRDQMKSTRNLIESVLLVKYEVNHNTQSPSYYIYSNSNSDLKEEPNTEEIRLLRHLADRLCSNC